MINRKMGDFVFNLIPCNFLKIVDMKRIVWTAACLSLLVIALSSCGKDDGGGGTTDPCVGSSLTMSFVRDASDPCVGDGRITVNIVGATGITYSLDGNTYQASNVFSNLRSGNYTVRAKTAAGCVTSTATNIVTKSDGPLFADVKPIIIANCAVSGCHNGAQSPNYTVDCNIANGAVAIKTRAVDQAGTSLQMPQPPRAALSIADRNKITAWVAAGGKVSN
jgi:hypothetical protein